MQIRASQKYNQAYTLNFDLHEVDGVDMRVDATFATGDITIMKDEGTETNTSNLPTDEGGTYSLVLTAAEMSAARLVVKIIDQTGTKVWLDISIQFDTYGNASAQHAFDLDTASVPQTADHTAGISAIPTTAMRGTDSAALASVCTETRLAELDAGNLPTDIAAIPTTAMRGTDNAATSAKQDTMETTLNAIPTTAMRGTDSAATAANLSTLDSKVDDIQGATFSTSTDSLEAIRNRGDSDWVTGGGGSAPTVEQITADMDANSTQLAAIASDANDLQANQGNWLTATGFNVGKTGYTLTTQNWNVGKTGYSLTTQDWNTTTPPSTAAIAAAVGFTTNVNVVSINGGTITGDGKTTPFDIA